MNELLGALLGGGTLGVCITAFFNHRSKQEETQLEKDKLAFQELHDQLQSLRMEFAEVKAELRLKEERIDALLEEKIKLEYECKNLNELLERERVKNG
ncbi:hypothetical protein [Enterococcus sp. DIV0800]|uniref:hypothetical protein n=1 Tax=unclassified Enterococcus TaxID=2608891 RepID=UPI003D2FEB20